tara:strand:+ start:2030 stop:2845 length:816 start_codon:yes stop_codon:yes gene_type:complete
MAIKKKKRKKGKKSKFNVQGMLPFASKSLRQDILKSRLDRAIELRTSDKLTERVVDNAGVVEKFGDFLYPDGGKVPVGTPYHIHYSRVEKTEIYMSGEEFDNTSMVLKRVRGNTRFGTYRNLKNFKGTEKYLVEHKFEITNKDKQVGLSRRYFARKKGYDSPIIEISKKDFKLKTPLYDKEMIKWSLNPNRKMRVKDNIKAIDNIVEKGFDGIEFALNPNEGFLGTKDFSYLSKLAKLKRISSPKLPVFGKKKKKRKKGKKKRKSLGRTGY